MDLKGDGSAITNIEVSLAYDDENNGPFARERNVSQLSEQDAFWLEGKWKIFTVSGNSVFGVFHVDLLSCSLAMISRNRYKLHTTPTARNFL